MENEKNKKENIFLGERGVTSTSANYVANVAKEMIRSEQEALDSLDFVTTTVSDDMHQEQCGQITKRGDDEASLMQIPEKLERVAKMKSLIGWLREGIKAKEEMIEKVKNMGDHEVGSILQMLQPYHLTEMERKRECWDEDAGFKFYVTKKIPTEEEYIAQLPEADQRKIQLLQTKAAVMGKFIHEKGAFGMARKQAFECERNPVVVDKGGLTKPTLFYCNHLEVSKEKIDEIYFSLQNTYREVQQELNSLLFKAKEQWRKECLSIEEENKAILQEYDIARRDYFDAVRRWKEARVSKISAYKIIIPQELRELYDEVNRIGK